MWADRCGVPCTAEFYLFGMADLRDKSTTSSATNTYDEHTPLQPACARAVRSRIMNRLYAYTCVYACFNTNGLADMAAAVAGFLWLANTDRRGLNTLHAM